MNAVSFCLLFFPKIEMLHFMVIIISGKRAEYLTFLFQYWNRIGRLRCKLLTYFSFDSFPEISFSILKTDHLFSHFAGMNDQALRVKLKFSFCLSYRAAYAPIAALLASEMVTSFLSVGLKAHASCQNTSREEQLHFPVEDWPSFIRHEKGSSFLLSCESTRKWCSKKLPP